MGGGGPLSELFVVWAAVVTRNCTGLHRTIRSRNRNQMIGKKSPYDQLMRRGLVLLMEVVIEKRLAVSASSIGGRVVGRDRGREGSARGKFVLLEGRRPVRMVIVGV